ncbi:MAG: hypothetical protein JW951_01790 [Lentisphaerae bacterium]|nr:hypothetical protein [Lentisphaerota bacterium]
MTARSGAGKGPRRRRSEETFTSLSTMASGLAHDFNNLLAAVLGNAAIVRRSLDPDSAAMSYACRIESTTREAVDLANDLLRYSGRGAIRLERCRVGALVREMKETLARTSPPGVSLRIRAASGLPPVDGDAALIRRAVLNLAENAMEALADMEGSVTVAVDVLRSGPPSSATFRFTESARGKPFLRIRVADTGCGMPRRVAKHMFDPFFSTKIRGRGMGLTPVMAAARCHRGALTVATAPRQGTTVSLYLPAAQH